MGKYKIAYDASIKGNMVPVGTEDQKALVLQIDSKSEETKIPIGGLAWFGVVDGSHWIIGCDENMGFTHTNLFFMKKDGEKWTKDPNSEKAFRTSYEANNYCYALNVDGNACAEALVKALDGKYIDSDFSLLANEGLTGDKVTETVNNFLEDNKEGFLEVFSALFSVLEKDEFNSQTDRKGNPIAAPMLGEDGKPVVVPFLPKIKTSGKGGYSAKPAFLTTAERVKDIIALKGDSAFEDLFNWYQTEPAKVAFALALTGVGVGLATYQAPVNLPPVDVNPKDKEEILENFSKVYDKEKGSEEDAEGFSADALASINDLEVVDDYKRELLKLSAFAVNGKGFPFGVTKQKLGVTGSVFKLNLQELKDLTAKAGI